MNRILLGSASFIAVSFFTFAANAQTPSPCTWNYSFVNGVSTASYCGSLNFSGLNLSGEPFIPYTFGGVNTLNTALINSTATKEQAEADLTLALVSTGGNTNPLSNYKALLQGALQLNGGSGSGWGEVISATYGSATYTNQPGLIGAEFDLNMGAYTGFGGLGTPNQGNILLTGTTSNNAAQFALGVLNYSPGHPLWNYGIALWDNGAQLTAIADIFDYTKSPTFISDSASSVHTTGIALLGSYTTALNITNHFTVSGAGATVWAGSGVGGFNPLAFSDTGTGGQTWYAGPAVGNGVAASWNIYDATSTTTVLTVSSTGIIGGASGFQAGASKGVTCSASLSAISSITIKGGIVTAATGTGGTCS